MIADYEELEQLNDELILDTFPKSERLRKHFIKLLSQPHEDNLQCVETPYDIAEEMCDLVMDAEKFIVFYSLEFLEILVYEKGIDPEHILFIADNEIEAKFADSIAYMVDTHIMGKNEIFKNGKFNENIFPLNAKSYYYWSTGTYHNKENEMKFNKVAVIGNPPYQMADGGHSASATPLYHLFVESIIDHINPDYFSMIIPSRWMVGGKGLNEHRQRMMKDHHMKKIVHFAGDNEVFSTVSIKGGVNYFLWEKNYDGKCEFVDGDGSTERFLDQYDIVIQNNNSIGILNKVEAITTDWIHSKVFGRKPFGLATNFNDWDVAGIKCIANGRKEFFVNPSKFTDKNGILGKWKVCTSAACGDGTFEGLNPLVWILEPNAICTETYIVVNVFDTEIEAKNFMSYMKTKFFRFMLGIRVATQHINKEKFGFVPDVKDYSHSWNDETLYKVFNLTRQQVSYIDNKMKDIK